MRHPHHASPASSASAVAALLIDYENLYQYLQHHTGNARDAGSLVGELIDGLRRHLVRENNTQVVLSVAYADFSLIEGGDASLQRLLCLQETEPRFVPSTLQSNAAELQLCIEAMELLDDRPDIGTLVVFAANRAYAPLLQRYRRYGRRVLLVALERPAAIEPFRDAFLDATLLLSESVRRELAASIAAGTPATVPLADVPVAAAPPPVVSLPPVTDPILLQTLEVIEEHFGQYDEIYLTPLLRKLSELLDERQNDPKMLISELEKASAVHLEKRRGYPYDYTVLIVNGDHPDVRRIQQAYYERLDGLEDADEAPTDRYYDEDDYDEEEYEYSDDYEADAVSRPDPLHDDPEPDPSGWNEPRR